MDSPNRSSRLNKTLYSLPVHCLNEADIRLENARGVNMHFHSPENRHNRYMASMTDFNRSTLRDIERPAVYTSKQQQVGQLGSSVQPGTAPPCTVRPGHDSQHGTHSSRHAATFSRPSSVPRSRARQQADSAIQQALSTTTQKGVPCYSVEAVVNADVVDGQPASPQILRGQEQWRVASVLSYSVPPSEYGYGEAGKQAFHQKYGWYKYYGFAGKGAKTSWASNPSKHLSREAIPHTPGSAPPGPQKLTRLEQQLMSKFPQHQLETAVGCSP